MYNKVSTNLDFVNREKATLDFWNANNIFKRSMDERKDGATYMFYDGPPTANGKPHIGHVITRVVKDLFPRYQTMKGNLVPRKAGWDTHGLPVELEVEKLLGLDGKEQIEQYGMAPFIEKCKENVWKYKGMWEDFSGTVGFWADMDDPYVTYHNDYIESVWWSLSEIWKKGLLYKGFKIVPYCPRCGTPLSSHEVAQGYKDVKDRTAIAKFKLKGKDEYFLAWTTTPWTLPSNVALCVNAKETYIKVACTKDDKVSVYYLAQTLASKVLADAGEYEVIEKMTGADLENTEYEPLFAFVSPKEKCWFVACDDFVTMDDGTGIVHIAPAFGETDAIVGRKYSLPFVQLVNTSGHMTAETDWEGVFCKDADKLILKDLKMKDRLFASPEITHSYPHCWRCDTPLIYYARDSWFIKMTDVKDDLIKNNKTINWIPETIGKGRFGDWIENVQDWGISRNRYWGTPLNIWECDCGHKHSVGSIAELKSMSVDGTCHDDIELHRPYIDSVLINCPECGGTMKRVSEVIDCWYDSGAMPFAQHHYPFENKDVFDKQFPADFISEAVDQTRGWFYSLLAISTLIFNKAPYKNVLVLGHVQDENGQKMSKSKGNAVDPFETLAAHGADAVRWYFYTNSAPWLPSRFSGRAVTEGQRKLMGTLWNTYAFYVLYANIDEFDPTQHKLDKDALSVMDKWLLSRLYTMVGEVDANLAEYKIPESARALQNFIDELSNWYVRRCRERYWAQGMTQDKINAYMTLYTALVTVAKAAAPMIPYISEDIYRNLVGSVDSTAPISVHLCDFPTADANYIDKKLEDTMEFILETVVLGRSARNGTNLKNRQPLSLMYVKADSGIKTDNYYTEIIKEELNLKSVEFLDNMDEFLSYSFKPQLKTVGPKYGKQLGQIKTALTELDGSKAKKELDTAGSITIDLQGGEVILTPEDLLIDMEQKSGYYTASDNGITIALDTTLTDALIEEGFVREIISKIQTMRKEAGFNVTDHIKFYISNNDKIESICKSNATEISQDTLSDEIITVTTQSGYTKEWDINGETAIFGVERT